MPIQFVLRASLYICNFSSIFSTDCFISTFSPTIDLYSCSVHFGQGGNLWQKMPKSKFLQAASGWFKLPIATTSMVEKRLEYLGLVSPCEEKITPIGRNKECLRIFSFCYIWLMCVIEPCKIADIQSLPIYKNDSIIYINLILTAQCRLKSL